MIFFGHIGITVGAVHAANRLIGAKVDLRKAAVLAITADLIDKPVGLLYPSFFGNHTRLLGHNFFFILFLLGAFLAFRRRIAHPVILWLAYAYHVVLDRIWEFNVSTFFWPLLGIPPAVEQAILIRWIDSVFWPYSLFGEVTGLAILGFLAIRHRLWESARLARFARTGLLSAGLATLALATAPKRALAGDGFVIPPSLSAQPLERVMSEVDAAHRLGARHFSVAVAICQRDRGASEIEECGRMPLGHYEGVLATLRARGFTTSVFPFLIARDGVWRGDVEPRDFGAWGASYLARLRELAGLAARTGAIELIVASELSRLYVAAEPTVRAQRERYWRGVLAEMRATLPGVAVYAVANWDQWDQIPFWDASDYIGLSAYFPIARESAASPSVETLSRGWLPWMERLTALSRSVGRPLVFAELGYPSREGAAARPWHYDPPATLDLDLQARLFEAFDRVWACRPELARFAIWALARLEEPLRDTGYSIIGKPAAEAVRALFTRRSGDGVPSPHGLLGGANIRAAGTSSPPHAER